MANVVIDAMKDANAPMTDRQIKTAVGLRRVAKVRGVLSRLHRERRVIRHRNDTYQLTRK